MRKNNELEFWQSARVNSHTFKNYYMRLVDIAISRIDYKNLPETVDRRYLELALFADGQALFFKDGVLGFLALRSANDGALNVYGYPSRRYAYAANGYRKYLTENDSVLIYDNNSHYPIMQHIVMYAYRLYQIERAIDVNVAGQRTPYIITCDEKQRLTFKNLFEKYEGNIPFIFGNKDLGIDNIKVFPTLAPYISRDLQELKTQIWNEALTYLGIANNTFEKRERVVRDEVARSMGGVIASRYSFMEERQKAVDAINRMFGLDISVEFKDGTDMILTPPETVKETEVEENV